MANTKISALSSATTPLSGSEIVPINQSGVTDSVTVANLTAGRAVSAASLSLTTTPLSGANGGTGQTAVTTGDLLYGSASNTWSRLGIGSTGQILRVVSGVPAWGTDYTGTVTSVAATVPSFLSISGSPITTSGTLAITLSGTALPTTSGGTGLTSFTSGGVVYASSTSALTTGSALIFDGANLGLGVTPSAWASAYKAFQVGASASVFGSSGQVYLSSNQYIDSSFNERYVVSDYASQYRQVSGQHRWSIAASGTAGNTISFAQALTLDNSGNLLLNTTSVGSSLASGHIQAPQGIAGGLTLTVSALSTRYAFNGGAANGILILRDNSIGGTAIWLLDPNNGALVISTNISATYTITYSGGNWGITQSTGATPKIWSYFMIAGQ